MHINHWSKVCGSSKIKILSSFQIKPKSKRTRILTFPACIMKGKKSSRKLNEALFFLFLSF